MAHPFKRVQMPLEDLNRMPTVCAWDGCEETFGSDMPLGWRWLLMNYSAKLDGSGALSPHALPQCDAVLCEKHARELASLLKSGSPMSPMNWPRFRPEFFLFR
jgi:hypothetical protein